MTAILRLLFPTAAAAATATATTTTMQALYK